MSGVILRLERGRGGCDEVFQASIRLATSASLLRILGLLDRPAKLQVCSRIECGSVYELLLPLREAPISSTAGMNILRRQRSSAGIASTNGSFICASTSHYSRLILLHCVEICRKVGHLLAAIIASHAQLRSLG